MNKKNFITRACVLLLGMLCLTGISCKKYLTEKPTTNFSADFVYNTPEGLELGVVSLYNLNRGFYENGEWNAAIPLFLQAKDDLGLIIAGEISLFGTLTWGAALNDFGTTRYGHYWRTYYKIIDRANAVIKGAEKLTGVSDAQRNKILAEAKAFRAQSYFILFKLFNNIFVTTEPTTPENASNIVNAKSSETEIYDLINSDLSFAISNLSWTTTEYGRFTQGAVRHIKAEVALWQKNWTEAKLQAEAVINSGVHSLVANTRDVFKGDLKTTETLFAIQYKPLVTGGGSTNLINFNFLPQYGAIPGVKYDNAQGGRGAGFILLNNYIRDLLKEDPNDDRDDNSYYVSYYTYNNPIGLPADKRLGDTVRIYNEFAATAGERNSFHGRLGAGCRKYAQDDAIASEAVQIKNIMVYRLAETYLFAAQANFMLGNTGPALDQVNAIRRRAKAAPLGAITQQAIVDEDAREMAFEGKRWYTLKRLGILISQIQQHAGYGAAGFPVPAANPATTGSPAFPVPYQVAARERIKPHMVNWPIPIAEIALLGPNYPQNAGY